MKRNYHRHHPHQIPDGFPIFLTWNLKGAMPKNRISQIQRERIRLEREPLRKNESHRDRAIRHSKILFAHADQYLDTCHCGPHYLRDDAATEIVENAIVKGANDRFILWAWCIMANHVHVLLTPKAELSEVTRRLKGATSYEINRLHDNLGRVVWQDESYDHWGRDEDELLRIIHYIENNPVKADLCAQASDWRRSSARLRDSWPIGTPFVGQALA
ncbi:MAG TPA: transposase [Lacipirellulaceae bacterium]|nr:transposase [Lacipirellulaceae bacterium]